MRSTCLKSLFNLSGSLFARFGIWVILFLISFSNFSNLELIENKDLKLILTNYLYHTYNKTRIRVIISCFYRNHREDKVLLMDESSCGGD